MCGVDGRLTALNTAALASGKPSSQILGVPVKQRRLGELLWFPQPVHLFVLLTVCYLSFLLFPGEVKKPQEPSALSNMIYLTTFATQFGAQFWMTFVSGIVLFFNLPRQVFGQVQRILFPKYFCMNACLGFVTLFLFLKHHPSYKSDSQLLAQTVSLAACFLVQLLTRLYIVPPMLVAMEARGALEARAGVGMEIGHHDPGRLRHCPYYNSLHRRFRSFHVACAGANVLAFACNVCHIYYLSQHLCLVT